MEERMKSETNPTHKADILVVDDTRDNLRLLTKLLVEHGYYARPVSHGQKAIVAIQDQLPDLILLDIMMPDMDGYAVCEMLKADERTRDIPVIFISALNETLDKVKAFSIGGVDFITKPFQEEEVLARVATQLALRQYLQEMQQRNRELTLVNQISHLFSASLDLEQVLQTTLTEIQRGLQAFSASVWLLNADAEDLICKEMIGPGRERLIGFRLPAGQGITNWVAQHGKSVVCPDILTDPRYHRTGSQRDEQNPRSMLSTPLQVTGRVIGVLNVVDPSLNHFSDSDLRFVEPIAAAAATAIENARLYEELRHMNEGLEQQVQKRTRELAETITAKERIESELRIAHDIQMETLPRSFPAFPDRTEIDLYAVLEPAKEVGGDFYDFFFSDEQHLWFVIGDVSGKGVPAALFMSATKTLIKAIATRMPVQQEDARLRFPLPDAVLAAVNQELSCNNNSCMFVTVFCGVLNTNTGEICYTNAGHNQPLLLRRDNGAVFVARSNCEVIGPDEETMFSRATFELRLGETLLLYTDGVTEAFNEQREQFSEERLQTAVTEHPGTTAEEIVKTVLHRVQSFAAGMPQSDDITILAVTYGPVEHTTEPMTVMLTNEIAEIQRLKAALVEYSATHQIGNEIVRELYLALEELLSNIIVYGYEDTHPHQIEVHLALRKNVLQMTIIDDAKPFNPSEKPEPDFDIPFEDREIGGMGIYLAQALMDTLEYRREEGKNILIMSKQLSSSAGEKKTAINIDKNRLL